MNTVLYPEDVVNAVRAFIKVNSGDENSVKLLLNVGSELLDVSVDTLLEMLDKAGG